MPTCTQLSADLAAAQSQTIPLVAAMNVAQIALNAANNNMMAAQTDVMMNQMMIMAIMQQMAENGCV